MFETDKINIIELKLLEGQIDLILRALELYAFNLHNTWGIEIDSDLQELRNALIFHTYEGLLSVKTSNNYKIGYDAAENCREELMRKKKKVYLAMKNKNKRKNIA